MYIEIEKIEKALVLIRTNKDKAFGKLYSKLDPEDKFDLLRACESQDLNSTIDIDKYKKDYAKLYK